MASNVGELNTGALPDWCVGCGDFSILMSIKQALVELKIEAHDTVLVSGIGCSGKMPHYVKTYGFEGIHGRALPAATGIKFANHKLNVMVVGGDGDGYGIGMGHLVHTMRRNIDMVYLVHDNQVYGLTKGQTSPTSEKGYKSKSTPSGALEIPLNPLQLAITCGATFVARGYAGDAKQLTELITKAVEHKGFALIDILQPCVTFNAINTYQYYMKRVYKLSDHDPTDKTAAWMKAAEWGEKIPTGIFYVEKRETYEDGLPQIREKALVDHDISNIDISALLKQYE